ncbi:PTS transporter subunit IIC [Salsuginibacillus kocurii]|uniref:PTS transporter subunit IIC n=1 Tax=Salsuginibacillus kocurii TaxID=427078 RepID=UPI0003731099|nr:PTS sugar transporter subunit IIC [Salsuginibacillus kocurii]
MRAFLAKKEIELSFHTYFITALSYMALGLFSSLIIGLIIETIGTQLGSAYLEDMGALAMSLMGPAIGAAVAYGLKAPPLVIFAAIVCGAAGAEGALADGEGGGPAGAFVSALVAVELGKLVSKETKVDILVTPFVTIVSGFTVAVFVGPALDQFLQGFGQVVIFATEQQPIIMGALVAILMGVALTAPISSAAIAIMLNLEGLAAGAATIGCTAQMVGFAVSSYRDNGISGLAALGVGTSMLQIGNVINKPIIILPPTIAGALVGPFATAWFQMENNAAGAGMGSSGLVGQIMTFSVMGFSTSVLLLVIILQFLGPALISLACSSWFKKKGWIKPGDMKIEQG